jgi:DNA-binding NtrC family response regulator
MVLDVRLPGESGMNVLAKSRSLQPELKTIIITAYPSEDNVEEAKKLGAMDYLIKPLVPDELERLIQEATAN